MYLFWSFKAPGPGAQLYANHVITINLADDKILWALPLVAEGTVLNVTLPDTHDWEPSFGTKPGQFVILLA